MGEVVVYCVYFGAYTSPNRGQRTVLQKWKNSSMKYMSLEAFYGTVPVEKNPQNFHFSL